jgi:hypothetical protein
MRQDMEAREARGDRAPGDTNTTVQIAGARIVGEWNYPQARSWITPGLGAAPCASQAMTTAKGARARPACAHA